MNDPSLDVFLLGCFSLLFIFRSSLNIKAVMSVFLLFVAHIFSPFIIFHILFHDVYGIIYWTILAVILVLGILLACF